MLIRDKPRANTFNHMSVECDWHENYSQNDSKYIEEMHEEWKTIPPSLVNWHGQILMRPTKQLRNMIYKNMEIPYSPYRSPTEFHLFKHSELFLRAKH